MNSPRKKLKINDRVPLDLNCLLHLLPSDITRLIAEKYLFFWNDILSLAKTCKHLYRALQNLSYKIFYTRSRNSEYPIIWKTPHIFGQSYGLISVKIKPYDCLITENGTQVQDNYIWYRGHLNKIVLQMKNNNLFEVRIPNFDNLDTNFEKLDRILIKFKDSIQRENYLKELKIMYVKLNKIKL
jgi:hypothetical protein